MFTIKIHVFFSAANAKANKLRGAQPPVRSLTGQERDETKRQWEEVALVLDMLEETVRELKRDINADEKKRKALEGPAPNYWVITCIMIDFTRVLERAIPSVRAIVEEAIEEIERFGCERAAKKMKFMEDVPGPWAPEFGLRERMKLVTALGKMEMMLDMYRDDRHSYQRISFQKVWSWGRFREEFVCLIDKLSSEFETKSLSFVDGLKDRSFNIEQASRAWIHVDQLSEVALPILTEIEALEDSDLRVDNPEKDVPLRVMIESFRERLVMRRKQTESWKMAFDLYCDTGAGFYGGALTHENDDENLTFGIEWDEQDYDSEDIDDDDNEL